MDEEEKNSEDNVTSLQKYKENKRLEEIYEKNKRLEEIYKKVKERLIKHGLIQGDKED